MPIVNIIKCYGNLISIEEIEIYFFLQISLSFASNHVKTLVWFDLLILIYDHRWHRINSVDSLSGVLFLGGHQQRKIPTQLFKYPYSQYYF